MPAAMAASLSLVRALALMAILKHRANIQRLFAGTEPRLDLGRKKKGEPT
jgi:glycerol-3-phosphate acyltransferase PlsY